MIEEQMNNWEYYGLIALYATGILLIAYHLVVSVARVIRRNWSKSARISSLLDRLKSELQHAREEEKLLEVCSGNYETALPKMQSLLDKLFMLSNNGVPDEVRIDFERTLLSIRSSLRFANKERITQHPSYALVMQRTEQLLEDA